MHRTSIAHRGRSVNTHRRPVSISSGCFSSTTSEVTFALTTPVHMHDIFSREPNIYHRPCMCTGNCRDVAPLGVTCSSAWAAIVVSAPSACGRHVWGRHVQLPYYVAGMRGAAAHEARLRWRAPAATRADSAGSGWRAALWRSGRAAQSPMRGRDT